MSIRKRLTQEESRLAALEAASALLIELGPQAVTLKAVASRIGRTHANLLHHFGSAAGLQKELAAYHAQQVCDVIADAVKATRAGEGTPGQVVDLAFDAFDQGGGAALATWMLLNGNEDALDPLVETIHDLVDELDETGTGKMKPASHSLVLLALGDALIGEALTRSLGLPRDAARATARTMLMAAAQEAGLFPPVQPC
ncbi:MAG: TetR family transcriptional regulator [Novosphingobium sp.]|uniref:TetR family transcriptional regulator n=1 Tax=Novosphingobium sp. TaxID=1874826 RepID=UPI001E000149|nr:TetR family transcriptional regulator [Novosphingobium sp.]MCB2056465.1 TetR family transcriptional regulator [Novosphingobium sp.]MCP5385521.1 TetR family transcriptional regulator [Novosphingobium sp.]HNJ48980.1 TetR family transcriptional regulator [Novosphingobium sp.]HNN55568.1 TetR family transcriptional regulator [Novosphingobium sp.]